MKSANHKRCDLMELWDVTAHALNNLDRRQNASQKAVGYYCSWFLSDNVLSLGNRVYIFTVSETISLVAGGGSGSSFGQADRTSNKLSLGFNTGWGIEEE